MLWRDDVIVRPDLPGLNFEHDPVFPFVVTHKLPHWNVHVPGNEYSPARYRKESDAIGFIERHAGGMKPGEQFETTIEYVGECWEVHTESPDSPRRFDSEQDALAHVCELLEAQEQDLKRRLMAVNHRISEMRDRLSLSYVDRLVQQEQTDE